MKNNRAPSDDELVIESIKEEGPEMFKALKVLLINALKK